MKTLLQGLLFFSILIFSAQVSAQNKYAIVIGINKYYHKPGVLYPNQLRGCENDAHAIKGMLMYRFGFKSKDIILLVNEDASRKKLEQAIQNTLNKVKAGDAFFFYFSGHGVWMDNYDQNIRESILKQGMNQALVLSDLYSNNLGCLFRDNELKRMFNKFVDRKVVSTGVFDCCFAGHMVQASRASLHNPYEVLTPIFEQKSLDFIDVLYSFIKSNDTLSKMENMDWYSVFFNSLFDDSDSTKSFNLGKKLFIHDPSVVVRPSERPHSMFLSLSATDEYEKGEETKDVYGVYHGVFTKAILQTIDNNPADISVVDLFNKVKRNIKNNSFRQTPLRFQDNERLSKNLIGIQNTGLKDNIEVGIKKINKTTISIDKGREAGLNPGNVLSLNGNKKSLQLQIISCEQQSAEVRIIQGSYEQLKQNDRFIRTSNQTKYEPLLKLYIQLLPVSISYFETYLSEHIIPLSKLNNYRSYSNWYGNENSQFIFMNKTGFINKSFSNSFLNNNKQPFFAFLPLPEHTFGQFKRKLQSNQNYEVVEDPSKANFVLYLNYSNDSLVITWAPYISKDNGTPTFYVNNLKMRQLPKDDEGITALTNDLLKETDKLAHEFTWTWLNEHPVNR